MNETLIEARRDASYEVARWRKLTKNRAAELRAALDKVAYWRHEYDLAREGLAKAVADLAAADAAAGAEQPGAEHGN